MAIDINGIFGRWPVRTPGIWEPIEYLRIMDRFGIERALITSTAALLDSTALGNQLVADLVRRFPARLMGACVVNPNPSAEHAAGEARRYLERGFRALRLYPGHHGYSAAEADLVAPLVDEARRAGVPVIVTLRVSGSNGFAETPLSDVRSLAERFADMWLIVSGATYQERLALTRIAQAHPAVAVEISHLHAAGAVEALCEAIGSDRVLLGTGMGVLYASPALRKVSSSGLPEEDRQAVMAGNARRLLRVA